MRGGIAVAIVCLGVTLALPAAADEPYRAGYLNLTASADPPVPVSVWYPTEAAEASFEAGPYVIAAARDAPLARGRHRLVVISHGSSGSDLGHHDLPEYLARNGIVVAAPRHLGDSFDKPRGTGAQQLITRPWQIVATLSAVLADERLAGTIDSARIGMAGFSAGGYTTLVISGATSRFELWPAHCAEHPDDHELCAGMPPPSSPVRLPEGDLPRETRIKAAVVMAPLGVIFDAAGLAGISIPLRLYQAADDHVLVNAWNAEHIVALLPHPPEHAAVPGGHYVFLAPCSPELATSMPQLCVDPPGTDRTAVHTQINQETLDFFNRTLGPEYRP